MNGYESVPKESLNADVCEVEGRGGYKDESVAVGIEECEKEEESWYRSPNGVTFERSNLYFAS